MVISPDTLTRIMQAREQATTETPVKDAFDRGDGSTVTRAKRIPRIQVYHLRYDRNGKVIDYHLDFWRKDANGLIQKLTRRDENGRPIWMLELPAGAIKPAEPFLCDYEECPRTFRSEADKDLHTRVAHSAFHAMTQQEENRRFQMEQVAALRALAQAVAVNAPQADLLARAIEILGSGDTGEVKGRGRPRKDAT